MRKLIFSGIFFISLINFAQNNHLGTWNILNARYNFNEKWTTFGEAQIRSLDFYNNFNYYEIKAGIDHKFHKNIRIALAIGTYQTFQNKGNFASPKINNEFRIWPQLIFNHKINDIKFEHRTRAEFRFNSDDYKNRFRYRLGILYYFGKKSNGYKPFQAFINNEIFLTDTKPNFERNRFNVGINFKINNTTTFQTGYINQIDYKTNNETHRNYLQVGVFFDFSPKNITKIKEIETLDN